MGSIYWLENQEGYWELQNLVCSIKSGISWQEFYDRFTNLGGDGFYANCINPYLEPIFKNKKIGSQFYAPGLAPIAEKLQKTIMAFKTNYLDRNWLATNCQLLGNLIDEMGR